ARQAGLALPLVLVEEVLEAAVGKFGDDDEVAADDLDAFDGEQEGVAKALDVLEGAAFLIGAAGLVVQADLAVDELDGLEQSAGGLALPNLPEATLAQRFEQSVAGDRFVIDRAKPVHRRGPGGRPVLPCAGRSGGAMPAASPAGGAPVSGI